MSMFTNGVGRPSNETIRKRNIFKGICALLVIVIIGLIGYILNEKGIIEINNKQNNNNNNVTVKDNSKVKEELAESEIEKLLVPFNSASNDPMFFGYYYKKNMNLNNLDSDIIILTSLINKLYQLGDKISSANVNVYIYNIFGSNIQYVDKTVEGICERYIYDSSSKYYDVDGGCSGDSSKIISKIIDYEKKNDKLIIKNKILVEDYNFGGYGIDTLYSDVDKKNIIDKVDTYKKEFDAEKEIDNYIDKLDTFKWTFVKENGGNYTFKSVEKVK